jgi:hypothetical protein
MKTRLAQFAAVAPWKPCPIGLFLGVILAGTSLLKADDETLKSKLTVTDEAVAQKAALLRAPASFNPHLDVIQLGEREDL